MAKQAKKMAAKANKSVQSVFASMKAIEKRPGMITVEQLEPVLLDIYNIHMAGGNAGPSYRRFRNFLVHLRNRAQPRVDYDTLAQLIDTDQANEFIKAPNRIENLPVLAGGAGAGGAAGAAGAAAVHPELHTAMQILRF